MIDGYNLLFFCQSDESRSLEGERKTLVAWLQAAFARKKWQGTVVFDGAHPRGGESGRSYPSPLEIAYAPKGQSADAYILEQLEAARHRKTLVVVTNDRALKAHVTALGAKTESNKVFVARLQKTSAAASERRAIQETPAELARLCKIFEERLEDPEL